jgi:hypothetical protein
LVSQRQVCAKRKERDLQGFGDWPQEGRGDDGSMGVLADGGLVVVETDDDWFLGTVELTADFVIIRTGFVGRPTVVAHEDVTRVVPAAEYLEEDELDEGLLGSA